MISGPPTGGITLDDLLGNQLLRIDKKFEQIPAVPEEVHSISEGGVYLFTGVDDAPLYVGLSDNLGRRLSAHLNGWGSLDIYNYNKELLKIKFFEESNSMYRDIYESYLIYTLNPRYNIGKTDRNKLQEFKKGWID